MNNGNLLTVILDSEIKSETSNTFSLGTGNNLERFNNTGNGLYNYMIKSAKKGFFKVTHILYLKKKKFTWCSKPEYSPSVFSRMIAISTSLKRDWTPGTFLQRDKEAYISKSLRILTLKDLWPKREVGVKRVPLRPILLRRRDSIDSWKRPSSSEVKPETSYCSKSTGTLAALKTSFTEAAISWPIPSPGIRVTVYLPPYFLGKI